MLVISFDSYLRTRAATGSPAREQRL
jgi:hypothetical protein